MLQGTDITEWIRKVATEKPKTDALVVGLQKYGATVEPDEDSRDVAALHYAVTFPFSDDVVVTVWFILMDYQTESDVVITNMTTLPFNQTRKGFGSQAIVSVLRWAADNGLTEVRATQVSGPENENFWQKNGFTRQEEPNPCNDFVWRITENQS